jgi:hypothetical protein
MRALRQSLVTSRPLYIVQCRGRSITIAVLLSIVPSLFWKLVIRL